MKLKDFPKLEQRKHFSNSYAQIYADRQRAADGLETPHTGFGRERGFEEWDQAYGDLMSESWSYQLKLLQNKAREQERNQVVCQSDFEDWE